MGRCALLAAVCAVVMMLAGVGAAAAADAPAGNRGVMLAGADRTDIKGVCGAENTVLVLMVRGSGEAPRTGKLATRYYPALAAELARRGYWVTGVDLAYPAADTALLGNGRAREYITSAVGSAKSLSDQIVFAIRSCPLRQIVLAAYSQGGIALRASASWLPAWARSQITHIDLVADGSAEIVLDRGMPTGRLSRTGYIRRGTQGIWKVGTQLTGGMRGRTLAAAALLLGYTGSRAVAATAKVPVLPPYPSAFKIIADRYCNPGDVVCDTPTVIAQAERQITRPFSVKKIFKNGVSQHLAYPWQRIGIGTAERFPTRTPPTPFVSRAFTDLGRQGGDQLTVAPEAMAVSSSSSCNPRFDQLVWSSWGPTEAVATGRGEFITDLNVGCAFATRAFAPVTIRLFAPAQCRYGYQFTKMSWESTLSTFTGDASIYCDAE